MVLHPPQPELPHEAEAELSPRRGLRHRRPLLHQIEFFDAGGGAAQLFDDEDHEAPEAEQQRARARFREAMAASARLLDPRLQKIITAAAEGWVVGTREGGGFVPR